MSPVTKSVLSTWGSPTAICGLLLAGNIFFVSRLVQEFYAMREIVWALRQQVAVIEAKMDNRAETAVVRHRR